MHYGQNDLILVQGVFICKFGK